MLVDARILRKIMVPARIEAPGDANWWLLVWLGKVLSTIDIEGGSLEPEPEAA